MAFPTTGLIDDFNRTDRGLGNDIPIAGTQWSGTALNSAAAGSNNLKILTNQMAEVTSSGNGYIITPTYGPDTELYVDVPTLPGVGQYVALFVRMQNAGTTTYSGYFFIVTQVTGTNNDTWVVKRVNSGTITTLATVATGPDLAAGDSVGVEVLGSGATVTLNVYRKPSAGSWTLIGSFGDTAANRITASGKVGFESGGTTGRFDNFSGGTATVAAKTGGAVSASVAGSTKIESIIRTGGGLSFLIEGATRTATYSKNSGSTSPAVTGATHLASTFKTGGSFSSSVAGGSKSVAIGYAKTAGAIVAGFAGATKIVGITGTLSKTGGASTRVFGYGRREGGVLMIKVHFHTLISSEQPPKAVLTGVYL